MSKAIICDGCRKIIGTATEKSGRFFIQIKTPITVCETIDEEEEEPEEEKKDENYKGIFHACSKVCAKKMIDGFFDDDKQLEETKNE